MSEQRPLAPWRATGITAGLPGTVDIVLLLAEDQEPIHRALAVMLALEQDFEVVAAVGRGDENDSPMRSGALRPANALSIRRLPPPRSQAEPPR